MRLISTNKKKHHNKKDSPSKGIHVIAFAAAALPSVRHINHQRLVLRLGNRPLADTEAAGLCLPTSVCIRLGGKALVPNEHRRISIILVQFLSFVAKVMLTVEVVVVVVLRCTKKGVKQHC